MNFKKIKWSALILFVSIIAGMQAQSLYVFEKNGAKTDFTLTNLQSITFSGSDIILNKKDGITATHYSIAGLRLLSFSQHIETSTPTAKGNTISVYPNPVRDILNIQYTANTLRENTRIEIISIDGKLVYSYPYNHGSIVQSINTNSWSRGIYILRLNTGTEVISQKIILN